MCYTMSHFLQKLTQFNSKWHHDAKWYLPGYMVSPLVFKSPLVSIVILQCLCHSNSTSVLLYAVSVIPVIKQYIKFFLSRRLQFTIGFRLSTFVHTLRYAGCPTRKVTILILNNFLRNKMNEIFHGHLFSHVP